MGNGNWRRTTTPPASSRSPNPSWGTGTAAHPVRTRSPEVLLTPHGERERSSRKTSRDRKSPPNPSWGTGTRPTPTSSKTCARPPNPSWGTGTWSIHGVWAPLDRLLTPHGERELRRPQSERSARSAPNPSWGTGTRVFVLVDCHLVALLTPHGERERRP